MDLPNEIPNARVLITVKTYPNPSSKYDELVCNAGLLETGEWIRIYPVKFRALPYDQQYSKYDWIELDLVRNTGDFRPESYRPRMGIDENIITVDSISTGKNRDWRERKRLVLNKEVFSSMQDLIKLSKQEKIWKSLATVKPKEIVKFEIQPTDRDWDPQLLEKLKQMSLFAIGPESTGRELQVVRKLPYKYFYHFVTQGDERPRRMMIEDWELGALYWKWLAQTEGDEVAANELVREKFEEELLSRDLYFFVGTTKANHLRAPNPFIIIGVFYPPHTNQLTFDF